LLTLPRPAELGARFRDRPLYLRLVQQPLQRAEVWAWRRHPSPVLIALNLHELLDRPRRGGRGAGMAGANFGR
jgi:hypothetical protein